MSIEKESPAGDLIDGAHGLNKTDWIDDMVNYKSTNVISSWSDVLQLRRLRGQSQEEFWGMFGVSQSAGARYESSRKSASGMRRQLAMLLVAFASGMLSEEDLGRLLAVTADLRDPGRQDPET
jgi:hypothetical protein